MQEDPQLPLFERPDLGERAHGTADLSAADHAVGSAGYLFGHPLCRPGRHLGGHNGSLLYSVGVSAGGHKLEQSALLPLEEAAEPGSGPKADAARPSHHPIPKHLPTHHLPHRLRSRRTTLLHQVLSQGQALRLQRSPSVCVYFDGGLYRRGFGGQHP